jgi:DNA-binding phage protein
VLAEQLEARAPEKAFLLYEKLAAVNARQVAALTGRRGLGTAAAAPGLSAADPPALAVHVPTFTELLRAGDIAPGKPLIFGFRKTGEPEKGTLSDQYSCVIIGLSGFGKTTFLAYNIACCVYVYQACFDVLDLHYPHKESLGFALGDLLHTPFVKITDNPVLLPAVISQYRRELANRLAQKTGHFRPRVLVVDEHERWVKNRPDLLALETDLVNEGRKVGLYLYYTSKSAKGDKIGDTALRDACVTSYVFKTSTGNARTFYQHDNDKVKLVKQLKNPGEAVYTNIRDDSTIVNVPFASLEDMSTVARKVNGSAEARNAQETVQETLETPQETRETPFLVPVEKLRETVRKRIETGQETLSGLAKETGVNKGQLYRFLKANDRPSEKVQAALSEHLETLETPQETGGNVVRFDRKRSQG